MAKHPPFDAVPALSNSLWGQEKAWVQMLQKLVIVVSHYFYLTPPFLFVFPKQKAK